MRLVEDPNARSGGVFYGRRAGVLYRRRGAEGESLVRMFVRSGDYVDPVSPDEEGVGVSLDFR